MEKYSIILSPGKIMQLVSVTPSAHSGEKPCDKKGTKEVTTVQGKYVVLTFAARKPWV